MTIVLAQGAWADGSSWRDVIVALTSQGLGVVTAPLPLTSLREDAAALARTIARTSGPVIAVGHAYAGAVIATAHEERVAGLVYIAALAPDEGETVAEVFYRDEVHPLAPALKPDAEGWIWMPDSGFSDAFAPRASAKQIAIAKAVQRPISVQCIQEKAGRPAWKTKPSWFLVAEKDRMISPRTQHFLAARMGAHTRSCAVDHTPLLTSPGTVVEIILAGVEGTGDVKKRVRTAWRR